MKKRLRKKLHRGEYREAGVAIKVIANENTAKSVLEILSNIADRNNLVFYGGGLGHIIVPGERYNDLTMSKKIEHLMCYMTVAPFLLEDCIMGYLIDPANKMMTAELAATVKSEIAAAMGPDFQINENVDLWD